MVPQGAWSPLTPADGKLASPLLVPNANVLLRRPRDDARADGPPDAYERYLMSCSDYLKRQMMVYEHWPQRRYDVLGYRNEKVFTDMNA